VLADEHRVAERFHQDVLVRFADALPEPLLRAREVKVVEDCLI
jgi:hypothetical protein